MRTLFSTGHSSKEYTDKNGFVKIDLPPSFQFSSQEDFSFSDGDVRSSIEKIWNEDSNYSLFFINVNQEAIQLLNQYIGLKGEKGDTLTVRKFKKKDDSDDLLYFSKNLREEYSTLLNKLCDTSFGNSNYASFPIVKEKTKGETAGLGRDWSQIYTIKEDSNSLGIKDLVAKLNDDSSYETLKSQTKNKYTLARIDLLRNKKILPLKVSPYEWRNVNAETLQKAINFLCQFYIIGEGISYGEDD